MENPISLNDHIPSAPVLKPSYTSSFENATRQFKKYWKPLLLIALFNLLIEYVLQIPLYVKISRESIIFQVPHNGLFLNDGNSGWMVLYQVLAFILTLVFVYGFTLATLKAARSEKPSVMDLFRAFKRFFPLIFSSILLCLILFVGFFLLIVPGIIFACKLSLVPFLILDQKRGMFDAINESWNLTYGHFWKIFLIGLTVLISASVLGTIILILIIIVTGGQMLLGEISNGWIYQIITMLIVIPFDIYILLLFSSLYHAISNENKLEPEIIKVEPPVNLEGPNPSTGSN